MDKPAPDEIERLLLELKDDRRDVRSRAAYELGKHNDPRTLMPLVAALSDNDKFVRSWAAGALGKAGPDAIEPLADVLARAEPGIACYAALALAELGDLRALPALAQAIREGEYDIRPSAAAALVKLGDADTLPDRILTDDRLTAPERVKLLKCLCELAYSDDEYHIHYSVPDIAEFCRERSQSGDAPLRSGAVESLQALEKAPAATATAAPETETSVHESGRGPAVDVGTTQDPSSAEAPAARHGAEKGKRSLWERLTGR